MKETGERIYLEHLNETVFEHVHRYFFAGKFVKDKIVLDVACGSGYGSNYLAQFAKKVYGLDKDEETIEENKVKFQRDNLEFLTGYAEQLPFVDKTFDVVVSFETIEHIQDYKEFLKEIKRVLKDDGILIISTPNKQYSVFKNHYNPYHVKEFYEEEFNDIINKYFKNIATYYQSNGFFDCIIPTNFNSMRIDIIDFNLKELEKDIIVQTENSLWYKKYFIIIASNSTIKNQENSSIINANNQLNLIIYNYEQQIKLIYNSKTYKLGKIIMFPIKFFCEMFKI